MHRKDGAEVRCYRNKAKPKFTRHKRRVSPDFMEFRPQRITMQALDESFDRILGAPDPAKKTRTFSAWTDSSDADTPVRKTEKTQISPTPDNFFPLLPTPEDKANVTESPEVIESSYQVVYPCV